ncbi:DUF3558 domain-containing protein [Mycolicibacterium thermoresistibile]
MRLRSARLRTAVAAALTALLAGCGAAPDRPPDRDAAPPGASDGFRSADCNGITDADVQQAVGAALLTRVAVGDAGCFWQENTVFGTVGVGNGVSTWWYRGADLDEERLLEARAGRTLVEVSIDGQQGFKAYDDKACSIYVAKGGDVMAWTLRTLNPASFGDLCAIVEQLAEVSHDRVN